MNEKSMLNGKIEKPLSNFTVACFMCGQQKPVMLYPHRKDGFIVGWVFVCDDDEKEAQGLTCEFKTALPSMVGRPTPDG